MRLGVIGLGAMGIPIAIALAESHRVGVFDIDPDCVVAAGDTVSPSASIAELVSGSDLVVTVLPGPHETENVVVEAAEHFAAGACWVDLGTGDPRATRRLADLVRERGVSAVAAPMAGGPSAAHARTLHFTVAGDASAVEGLGPVLDALAAPGGVEVIGTDPADAQTVKLLSNLLWFGQVIAVTEALLLGRAMGLEPATLRALLATRAGSSVVLERDYEAVLRGDYMASFSLDRVIEQLATASALATELHVPFELSTLVEKTHRAAREAFGPIAGELLAARLLEERDGRALRA